MLVLTRKTDERIRIGDGVELVVLSIRGRRVRLGITAPAEATIARMPAGNPRPILTDLPRSEELSCCGT